MDRLVSLAGDLTTDGLGLSAEERQDVCSSVDVIVHCAAETSFIRDQNCNRINIGGMQEVIDFARQCRKQPLFVHISTATVCGAVRDMNVVEDFSCDPEGEHYNQYTRSKAIAECMLRESGLRYVILRPSIVVSAGLRDRAFANAMLWWLPLLNQLDAVPINPTARIDLVTVSFVAHAIRCAINASEHRYDCYHLSAGWPDATLLGQAGQVLDTYYDRPAPLRLIQPDAWTRELHRTYIRTPEQRKMFMSLRHYLPFLNMNVAYDNTRLRELLGKDMPPIDPFDSYAAGLLDVMSPELMPEA